MPRSILLGRPWPGSGEPLFLDDDVDGALELQADEDMSCPRGHHLDETVGDDGPPIGITQIVCIACAEEDAAKRAAARDLGQDGADLLDGRYFFATVEDA